MPVLGKVSKNGTLRYTKGIYSDEDGKLKKYAGQKVRITEGWYANEILVVSISGVFICHAKQTGNESPVVQQKFEAADYELSLKCLYKIVSGKETFESIIEKTNKTSTYITPIIENLLQQKNGFSEWTQTRDNVWRCVYRENDNWELLCVIKRKRKTKYSGFSYVYDNGITKRDFHGRFLSLNKAKYAVSEKAKRRSRWIPPKVNEKAW